MFHSALFIWKRTLDEDCPENSAIDIFFEISSVIYTFIILLYFTLFYDNNHEYEAMDYILLLFIILSNVCIWLNAIVFESDFLYEKHSYAYNSSTIINVTKSSNNAAEAIEKIDIFCSPAMVEFSLIVIEVLITKYEDTIVVPPNGIHLPKRINSHLATKCQFVGRSVRFLFAMVAVSISAIVFTVVLTTNSFEVFLDFPKYITFYFWSHLTIKFVMLVLIGFCLGFAWHFMKITNTTLKHSSSIILLITCVANIFYHINYCIALTDKTLIQRVPSSIVWFANIFSVLLAPSQTYFLIGINSQYYYNIDSLRYKQSPKTNFIYNACFILGVLNLGLWASDSIGEQRRSIFNILFYWTREKTGWSIVYTIIFPMTVYFRFLTGMEFLKFFWERN